MRASRPEILTLSWPPHRFFEAWRLVELYLVLAVFGCLSGVTAVLFGFGGGFIVVPVLYHCLLAFNPDTSPVAESAMQVAVATSTCVMIANAIIATRRHHLAGNVPWAYLFPLFWYVGVGAALGAVLGVRTAGDVIRWAFVVYVAVTLVDCVARQGFMTLPAGAPPSRPMNHGLQVLAGTLIGAIATFLGVGGSVMTVPLMRRRGHPMRQAVAAANPLSIPVAVVGALGYAIFGQESALPGAYIGYIDLAAFAVLAAGAWLGIRLAAPWGARITDKAHALGYVALLALALVAMVIG